jgi:hypothetical protein
MKGTADGAREVLRRARGGAEMKREGRERWVGRWHLSKLWDEVRELDGGREGGRERERERERERGPTTTAT